MSCSLIIRLPISDHPVERIQKMVCNDSYFDCASLSRNDCESNLRAYLGKRVNIPAVWRAVRHTSLRLVACDDMILATILLTLAATASRGGHVASRS